MRNPGRRPAGGEEGFDGLIDACAILRDRGVAFQCRIVGEGAERANLSARIEKLNLGARVRLVGPQPHAELIGTFREAAVVAAPCVIGADGDRDGLPTVLLEAMALGVPCVATDLTGIPELVRDGDSGLCVSQRDPSALADALQRLLDDADLRVDLATRARRLIEQDFDIRRNAAHLREWFAVAACDASAGRREGILYIAGRLCLRRSGRAGVRRERFFHSRAGSRPRAGAEVMLFATRLGDEPPADLRGISVHPLPALPSGEPSVREPAALAANRALRAALTVRGPFDLIYERYALWSHAGMDYARKADTPGILEVNAP